MRYKFFVCIYIITYILFNLLYLDKYPLIWNDDSIYPEPGWHYLKHKRFLSEMFSGFIKMDETNSIFGRIYLLSKSLSFKIFGFGPFQTRLPSLFFGIFSLLFFFLFSKELYGKKIAFLATFLLSISQKFIFHLHDARPEIMLFFSLIISLYLFILSIKKSSNIFLFFSGLTSSLSIDIHPNGLLLILVICVLFVFKYYKEIFSKKKFIYLGIGLTSGILWYIFVHIIIPGPDLFFYQWNNYWYQANQPAFTSSLLSVIKKEFYRYYYFFWVAKYHRNAILLFLFLISFIYALKNKKHSDKIIITVILISILFLTFVCKNNTTLYLILIFPFFILLSSEFIIEFKNYLIKYSILFFIFFLFIAEFFYIGIKFKDANYYIYIQKLKKYIPENTVILGHPPYWYGFAKTNRYFADIIFWYLNSSDKSKKIYVSTLGSTFEEGIEKKNIDYIIISESFWWWYDNIKDEIKNFLNKKCIKIATIIDDFYGTGDPVAGWKKGIITEIYQIKKR